MDIRSEGSIAVTDNQSAAHGGGCAVLGLRMLEKYERCQPIYFTAVGEGLENDSPNKGDVRWVPYRYSIGHYEKYFMFDFTVCFVVPTLGQHMVDVDFRKECCDGLDWRPEENYMTLSIPILIV